MKNVSIKGKYIINSIYSFLETNEFPLMKKGDKILYLSKYLGLSEKETEHLVRNEITAYFPYISDENDIYNVIKLWGETNLPNNCFLHLSYIDDNNLGYFTVLLFEVIDDETQKVMS